jgi:hypothetical protein
MVGFRVGSTMRRSMAPAWCRLAFVHARGVRRRRCRPPRPPKPPHQNADGSLTLYVQKDSPGKDKESDWLPAPDGPIYMVMRLYWPKTEAPSILPPGEGTWQPPGLAQVN